MTKLKIALFLISLSLEACASLPPFPEIWQCAYSVKFDKFRCVNTSTKAAINLKRNDPRMEAAQCLSADDYKKSEEWLTSVLEIANKRCR